MVTVRHQLMHVVKLFAALLTTMLLVLGEMSRSAVSLVIILKFELLLADATLMHYRLMHLQMLPKSVFGGAYDWTSAALVLLWDVLTGFM